MVNACIAPTLSAALTHFKEIIARNAAVAEEERQNIAVFCEDRLSLAAEKAVCEAAGGSFSVCVYTLSRFLSAKRGRADNVLTSQGSAMALRSIIDANTQKLNLFRKLSATGAAQEVYDTIALLYSSGVSAEDLGRAEAQGELLRRKLADLKLLYSEYSAYLEENGLVDRNEYLRQLPEVISSSAELVGAHVVILGFQAFTASVRECVRACIRTAADVSGLFIGGRESFYVNQAWSSFSGVAAECGKPADIINLPSDRVGAAEHLRRNLFDTLSFHRAEAFPADGRVNVAVAADEAEECNFIAAEVVKCVRELGLRYREISVMLPDIPAYQPLLERAFRAYGIPLYADRRYPLVSHPLCRFLMGYLACLSDGCRLQSVVQVVSSPVFLAAAGEGARADKDVFVNYLLRAASSRGGVKREINRQICEEPDLSYTAVSRIRDLFLEGLSMLSQAKGAALAGALKALADRFTADVTLGEASKSAAFSAYPEIAAMNARAYECAVQVLQEAERLAAGQKLSVKKLSAILKSGFTAAEISLIPPKQDAVFVGDLSATANTGSKVIFAAGLTDGVPACSQDIAILTDAELASLEELNLAVSPKISEVNDRVREITALNLVAFSERLYLIYPLRRGGEECARSEVADYALRLFSSGGKLLEAAPCDYGDGNFAIYPDYFSRPLPALGRLAEYSAGGGTASPSKETPVEKYSAVCAALGEYAEEKGDGYISAALKDITGGRGHNFSLASGRKLYGKSLSPTALESYFSCPYKCFMTQGLKLAERVESALRPLDSGNFIHSVLEKTAGSLDGFGGEEDCARFAADAAKELLAKPQYAAMSADKRGEYTAKALSEEAVKVSVGAYRQLANSRFKVTATELGCRISLGEISLWGRIDRVDSCDDLVRIIDYKTGATDDSASSYYMGLKTQLPLYLLAASKGRRAAGAYYFPAKVEYSSSEAGSFCLQGFMDGSADVVRCSDVNVQEKGKSVYVNAYLNGRKLDKAMEREQFADFLDYAVMVSGGGAGEMLGGNIAPSPVQDACGYCKFGGCCGYDLRKEGERRMVNVNCARIAEISRQEKEGKKDE